MQFLGFCNKNPLVDENDVCHPMQILKYIVFNLYFPYIQGFFIAIFVTTSMVSGLMRWRFPEKASDHINLHNIQLAVGQNLVPLVNIKIAGKWMFIPLKMV